MYIEIKEIQKNVIDKIIVISVIFLTPTYFSSIARWIEIGWQDINYIYTILFLMIIGLLVFRKRLTIEFKLYTLVFIYTLLGLAALWFLGFSSIHYFVIVAIALATVLFKRKIVFLLVVLTALAYIGVGIMYVLHKHEASVDLNRFSHSILQWTTIILSLIAFSAIFVEGFGELYHKLIFTIEEKQKVREKLENRNEQLISIQEELDGKIKEVHKINKQLQESETKYRDLVNFSPDIIYMYSIGGRGLFFSDRIKEALGYTPEEIEQNPELWKSSVHPEDQEIFKRKYKNLDTDKSYNLKYRFKTKEGNWRWLKDTFTVVKRTGQETILQGHLVDITTEKEIEEKLYESESRWHFSVDGSNLGLWDWDVVNNSVFYSKNWKKMLGFKDNEVEHTVEAWETKVHPEDKEAVCALLTTCLSGEIDSYEAEHRLLCKNGTYKWILAKGKIVSYTKDGKPKRMIGTHADIHEKKLVELELRKSNATKDKFFSIIAHDLKNPFNSMIGLSEMLNDNFDDLDVKNKKKFVAAIHDGIVKTYDLLEDLLLWSRAQRNTLDFYPKNQELIPVVNEVLSTLNMAAENKTISIVSDISLEASVFADKFMLSFILRNLVSNAIKFTPKNGKVTIAADQVKISKKLYNQISVRDNGIGMEKNYMDNIFGVGQTISRRGTEEEGGTGTGLPICYEFVKKHGGDIWAESTPGEGSHFFFTLPVNK